MSFLTLRGRHLAVLVLAYLALAQPWGLWPMARLVAPLARDPFHQQPVETHVQFVYDSWLHLALQWAAGGGASLGRYLGCDVALLLLTGAAFAFLAHRRYPPDLARALCLALALSPVTTVLTWWVGCYDALTFALQVGLFFARSAGIAALLGFLGGLNHAALLATSGAALLVVSRPEGWQRLLAAFLSGCLLGLLALKGLQQACGMQLMDRWQHQLAYRGLGELTANFFNVWPGLLYSLYGRCWPLAIALASRRLPGWKSMAAAQLGFLALTFLTLDSTRTFALLSWPLGLAWLARGWRNEPEEHRRFSLWLAAALALPGLLVWEGWPHLPSFKQTVHLLHFLVRSW